MTATLSPEETTPSAAAADDDLAVPLPATRSLAERRWFVAGQWIVVPLVVVLVVELVASRSLAGYDEWYTLRDGEKPTAIFIGSSRTTAAVDADLFARELSRLTGQPQLAKNYGRGHSTVHEHLLAMREIVEQLGPAADELTVFVEAPRGLPTDRFVGTWSDSWVFDEEPALLARFLDGGDVARFLGSSTSTGDKMTVVARWLLRGSSVLRFREGWREALLDRGGELTGRALERIAPGVADADLSRRGAGGIRTDAVGVAAARKRAVELQSSGRRFRLAVDSWDEQVLDELVRSLRRAGARVVFVEMPLSSAFDERYRHAGHAQDRREFDVQLAGWGTPMLSSGLSFDDEDFPDLWHLGAAAAEAFTRRLAAVWAAAQPS